MAISTVHELQAILAKEAEERFADTAQGCFDRVKCCFASLVAENVQKRQALVALQQHRVELRAQHSANVQAIWQKIQAASAGLDTLFASMDLLDVPAVDQSLDTRSETLRLALLQKQSEIEQRERSFNDFLAKVREGHAQIDQALQGRASKASVDNNRRRGDINSMLNQFELKKAIREADLVRSEALLARLLRGYRNIGIPV